MKDISKACGVSVATVSKALNDHGDIGEETKRLIKQVAKDMGYFPNAQARALKTNCTKNIGVLFVDDARSGLTHDYFSHLLDAFKSTVEEKGYDVTFINSSRKGRNQLSILNHCMYRGFDGVMIACVDFKDSQVVELVQSGIPVVTIDHLFSNGIAVMSDNAGGIRDLVQYVYDQGHRRIAYIHGADSGVTQKRLASFYKTMEELDLSVESEYIDECAYRDADEAARITDKLLDLPNPPSCILYADDFSCFGGMNVIRERGLKIPEDISVAGFDGILLGQFISPKLTTVYQDTMAMGQMAARKLIDLIEKPRSTVQEPVLVKTVLEKGGTVGSLN